jgi:hypothetical protein
MAQTQTREAHRARPLSRRRRLDFAATAVFLSGALALVVAELALRIMHRRGAVVAPTPAAPKVRPEPPNERDPVTYWRCREGRYVVPPLVEGGPEVHDTVLAGGRRATETTSRPGRPIVALVGCSYTHGVALNDEDTFAWKLQAAFPDLEFRNYGTPGNGTFQALLTLERLFQGPEADRPALALYGYIWFHPWRNVASSSWMKSILLRREDGGRAYGEIPYCTIDRQGSLVRHEPDTYRTLPLGESLETVSLLESAYNFVRCRPREKQYRRVTDALLLAMRDVCRKNGAGFVDVILTADEADAAREVASCRDNGIDVANCSRYPIGPEWMALGDPHPNATLNAIWAEDIGQVLGVRFRNSGSR